MIPRPDLNALLLITHPGGGKSFDYDDYWDGADLMYTGRGKKGDQSPADGIGARLLRDWPARRVSNPR
jgi:hypothetical protein